MVRRSTHIDEIPFLAVARSLGKKNEKKNIWKKIFSFSVEFTTFLIVWVLVEYWSCFLFSLMTLIENSILVLFSNYGLGFFCYSFSEWHFIFTRSKNL
jgi:hypothetical protein